MRKNVLNKQFFHLLLVAVVVGLVIFLLAQKSRKTSTLLPNEQAAVIENSKKYRQLLRFDTGLTHANGIALDQAGNIYISAEKSLARFDATGKQEVKIKLPESAYALAVSANQEIFLAMRDHIVYYPTINSAPVIWPSSGKRAVYTGVAIGDNSLWVADAGNRVVWHFNMQGKEITALGREKGGKSRLIIPSYHLDVILSKNGAPIVNNPGKRLVEQYSVAGKLLSSWGESSNELFGFSGCCNPTDIALLPNGNVVTSEKGLLRVKEYNPQGKLQALVAQGKVFSSSTASLDLVTDAAGDIYVLQRESNVVQKFSKLSTK